LKVRYYSHSAGRGRFPGSQYTIHERLRLDRVHAALNTRKENNLIVLRPTLHGIFPIIAGSWSSWL
jgi:hypothetical protein